MSMVFVVLSLIVCLDKCDRQGLVLQMVCWFSDDNFLSNIFLACMAIIVIAISE